MLLFTSIILLSLFILIIPSLMKRVPIGQFMRKRSENYTADLQQKLSVAKEELRKVRSLPPSNEYSYQIKVLRAEEGVKEIEKSIKKEKDLADLKRASAETLATYSAKALVSLVLIIISIRNRYTPVMIFDERFNFQPLTGLFSFPTGVPNAISVPMWILSCNVTINFITSLFKKDTGKKSRQTNKDTLKTM